MQYTCKSITTWSHINPQFFSGQTVKQGSHLAELEPRDVASWRDLMASRFIINWYQEINSWYQEIILCCKAMVIPDIKNSISWYQEFDFVISGIRFRDIKKYVLMIKLLAIRSSQLATTRGSNSAKWERCFTGLYHSSLFGRSDLNYHLIVVIKIRYAGVLSLGVSHDARFIHDNDHEYVMIIILNKRGEMSVADPGFYEGII